MTSRGLWLGLVLVAALSVSTVGLAEVKGEANLFIGQKGLDFPVGGGLEDVEDQTEFGVALTFGDAEWPVLLALDLLASSESDSYVTGTSSGASGDYEYEGSDSLSLDIRTTEFNLGIRWFMRPEKKLVGYVGGGVAVIFLNATAANTFAGTTTQISTGMEFPFSIPTYLLDSSDSAIGYWANAGLMWRLTEKLSVGFDARYSDAEVTLNLTQDAADLFGQTGQVDLDSGGVHAGLTVGYRW